MKSQQRAAAETAEVAYRESMILVGIRRGLDITGAIAFAEQCVAEQQAAREAEKIRQHAKRLTQKRPYAV